MAKSNKTLETKASVASFIKKIKDEKRRKDFITLVDMISRLSKFEPKMWGPAIVGFGSYHYKYESGREGDAPIFGLASRVNAITIYIGKFEERDALLTKLGKHKIDGGCLYVQKLDDIDQKVLEKLIKLSIAHTKKTHKC